MRVARYYHNNDVRLEEFPLPEVNSGEIKIKVQASGICGSDVLEWYRIKKAPLVLGHEVAGEIVEIGPGVDSHKVGDRVFVSHHVPCNTCYYCLRGHHTACETLHNTNYIPGGFAEYILVPRLNADRGVFLLPEEMSFEEGSFIEPLACVVRGQRLARWQPGQSVLILGSGISGLLHLLLARSLGAGRIFTTDISEYRLKAAREFGATAVFPASKDIPRLLKQANNNRLADLVIVCTGSQSAFNQAPQCLDRGGTILLFASSQPEVEFSLPLSQIWRDSIKVITSYGNSPLDAVEAIELIGNGRVPVKEMITHRLNLEEASQGFRLVAEADQSLKVILFPHK